jgi:hypothetical protein
VNITILDDTHAHTVGGRIDGDAVFVAARDFAAATGWELKPEGLCRGAVCVPLGDRSGVAVDDEIDAVAVAPLLGRSVVADANEGVIAYAAAPAVVAEELRALNAPDFTLPQIDGTPFTLSALGRQKKLLFAWASW